MSLHTYDLICRDCRVNLSMGYPANDTDELLPDRWDLSGISSDTDFHEVGVHHGDEFYCRVFAKFLILHRNHRISFIPSEAVGYLEELDKGWYKPLSPDDVLAQLLDPPFLPRQEAQEWKQRADAVKKNR